MDAWVVRKEKGATVLLTNHAMPRHPIHTELVNLRLIDAPQPATAYVERIDQDHANPRRLWQTLGEPKYLSALQVEQLKTASSLVKEPQPWTYEQGNINLAIALPPQSVAAITMEFA